MICIADSERLFSDKSYVVLGHTPTEYLYNEIGQLSALSKFYRADTFIDIDCGCVFTGRLGCLCLDTREEIYV